MFGLSAHYMLYRPIQRSWPAYVISLCLCVLIRLIPGRPPNVEPILATVMPLSREFGVLDSALFAALNILVFDLLVGQFGTWSVVGATTYAAIAAVGCVYLKHVKGLLGYLSYSVLGIVFFDFVTGVVVGPLMFHQSFREAFFGQIPFTVNHVLGTLLLALLLSPAIEKWLIPYALNIRLPVRATR